MQQRGLNKRIRMKKIIIAIDGFSSSGKSTIAKKLAREIGYKYIDTGAMYRAVTLYCLRNQLIIDGQPNDEAIKDALKDIRISFQVNPDTSASETYLNGENVEKEIRGLEVSNLVSPIARIGFVREYLVEIQQQMGEEKGMVMDGRDIGTVVFPQAELKIFVTASPEIRAQRRYDEMRKKGEEVSYEEILQNIQERDHIDTNRPIGPLRQADDAILLDNSSMSIAEQDAWILQQYLSVAGQA